MAIINFLINLLNNFIVVAYADLSPGIVPPSNNAFFVVVLLAIPVLFVLVPAIIFIILLNRKK